MAAAWNPPISLLSRIKWNVSLLYHSPDIGSNHRFPIKVPDFIHRIKSYTMKNDYIPIPAFRWFPLYVLVLMEIPKWFSPDLFWQAAAVSEHLKREIDHFPPSAHGFPAKKRGNRGLQKNETVLCEKSALFYHISTEKTRPNNYTKRKMVGGWQFINQKVVFWKHFATCIF